MPPAVPTDPAAARAAAALAAVPDRVSLLCDTDGTVAWASPTCLGLLDLAPEALVGTTVAVVAPRVQPIYVLGGDGRPRRIDMRVVDLRDDPVVAGFLVEWQVHVERPDADDAGLLTAEALAAAVVRLGDGVERGIGVVRLRPHRVLPADAVAVLDQRLRHVLRASDLACRLDDGDVVVVCTGHWTPASAAAAAQRLRSHVNGPVRAAEGIVAIRLEAGTATGTTSELVELVRRAAFALPESAAVDQPVGSSANG
jgi:PAS domain-containing protein